MIFVIFTICSLGHYYNLGPVNKENYLIDKNKHFAPIFVQFSGEGLCVLAYFSDITHNPQIVFLGQNYF